MKRCVALSPQLTQRVCIWFATKLDWSYALTITSLRQCFGQRTLSKTRVYYWMEKFQNGRTTIVDLHRRPKRRSGRSRANIRLVEDAVTQDRRSTIPRLMLDTGLKHTTVQRILTLDLKLSKKCAKYVPHLLTNVQTRRRLQICDFWVRLRLRNPAVFRVAVTMDESWAYCYDPATKEQSREWLRAMEPRPQKPRCAMATAKVMVVSFFDASGLVYREFVRRPATVNQITFRQIITRFDIAHQNRRDRCRGSTRGYKFIHMDNAPAHIADLTGHHLRNLGWTTLPHPAYSPDLVPSDFWFFPQLKKNLKGRRFVTVQELEDAVDAEIASITADKYHVCMAVKWPARWRKCLAQQGGYFEGVA